MNFLDYDLLLYLAVIFIFAGFFLWNRSKSKKGREKKISFRNRYQEKRKNSQK